MAKKKKTADVVSFPKEAATAKEPLVPADKKDSVAWPWAFGVAGSKERVSDGLGNAYNGLGRLDGFEGIDLVQTALQLAQTHVTKLDVADNERLHVLIGVKPESTLIKLTREVVKLPKARDREFTSLREFEEYEEGQKGSAN